MNLRPGVRGRVVPSRRRAGRRNAPFAGRRTARNPLTGRALRVGGRRFHALTRPGGPLVPRDGTLDINYGDAIRITHIYDPSDPAVIMERDILVQVPANMRRAFAAVVEGREPFARRVQDWLTDEWIPALAPFVARFEFGPREWTEIEEDDNGEWRRIPNGGVHARLLPRGGILDFLRARGIRANTPLILPYANVLTNAAPDHDNDEGACVERFFGAPGIRDQVSSIVEMVAYAETRGIPLRLFDVLGTVISEVNVIEGMPAEEVLAGIIYNKHVYPLETGARVPILNGAAAPSYNSFGDMARKLHEDHNMLWRVGSTFYTPGGKSKMAQDTVLFEDWMSELFSECQPALGWDDGTLEVMRRGTVGLFFCDRPVGTILDPAEFVAIDMSKCYYNVLRHILALQRLPTVALYDRFEPVLPGDPLDNILSSDFLMIDSDLSRYGFRTNVISGETYNIYTYEFEMLPPIRVIARLRPRMVGTTMQKKMLAVLDKWDPPKQKKYALVNGMFGKVRKVTETWLEVNDPNEHVYYEREHGFMSRGPDMMSKTVTFEYHSNRFHVYTSVVHTANAAVFRKMMTIWRDTSAGLPSKIKVDSLTYERSRLRTPFDRTGTRALGPYVAPDTLWHYEPLRDDLPLVRNMNYRVLTLADATAAARTYERNITFIGPPGTGKTYQAMRLPYDLAMCFSNKGARRIGGITIDAALGMRPGAYKMTWDKDKIAGKRVFVDEAQAMRPEHWGSLKYAYLKLGTTFIFALDPDQIPPVEHERYPVREHPFWGAVTHLTEDHRNEPSLIAAREQVLAGTFEPPICEDPPETDRNIAFTNKTRKAVNEMVAARKGLSWLDTGRYIAVKPHAKSGVCKGEILHRYGPGCTWRRDTADGPGPLVDFPDRLARTYLEWAWCVTIHNTIGETFHDPYTIWDCGHVLFSKKLMYTALTRGISLDRIVFRGSEV